MPTEPPPYGNSGETAATEAVPQADAGDSSEVDGPGHGSAAEPSYGTAQPSYGTAQPSYGTAEPTYGASQPAHGTSGSSYGTSESSYGTSGSSYDESAPSYGAPSGSPYGSPGGSEPPAYGSPSWAQGTVPTPTGPATGTPWQPSAPTPGGDGGQLGAGRWGPGPSPTTPAYGGPAGSGFRTSDPRPAASGFLSKLFDLSFTSFITPSIVRIVYVIAMLLIGLGWLGYSVVGFARSPGLGLLILVVVGPLLSLFYLVVVRITLELYLAVIRLAEDVHELKLKQE